MHKRFDDIFSALMLAAADGVERVINEHLTAVDALVKGPGYQALLHKLGVEVEER